MISSTFDKIDQSKYVLYSSFALWDEENITNTQVIADNIRKLKNNYVVLGLNGTRMMRKYENYHCKFRGCRDSFLKLLFNNSNYCGSYMTDIIFDNRETNSKNITAKLEDLQRWLFAESCG